MGHPIARRLVERNYSLVLHDADPAAQKAMAGLGADAAASPMAVANAADVVVVCLPRPDIVREVALGSHGVIEGTRARYLIDISTTGTSVAREIDAAFKARGKAFVDAPVTGSVAGAISGKLTVIVGAAPQDREAVLPVLKCIGETVVVAGDRPGDGQMLKTINNLLSFIALEATAEAMVLGTRYGLKPETMLQVFNAGTGRNSATQDKFPKSVLPRTFDFGFPVWGVNKDIGLCLEEADRLGVPMPVGYAAQQIWRAAAGEMKNDDMTSIVKLFERWVGVVVNGESAR
jgi:2-hydroxy-3-oxopropionate reductase